MCHQDASWRSIYVSGCFCCQLPLHGCWVGGLFCGVTRITGPGVWLCGFFRDRPLPTRLLKPVAVFGSLSGTFSGGISVGACVFRLRVCCSSSPFNQLTNSAWNLADRALAWTKSVPEFCTLPDWYWLWSTWIVISVAKPFSQETQRMRYSDPDISWNWTLWLAVLPLTLPQGYSSVLEFVALVSLVAPVALSLCGVSSGYGPLPPALPDCNCSQMRCLNPVHNACIAAYPDF